MNTTFKINLPKINTFCATTENDVERYLRNGERMEAIMQLRSDGLSYAAARAFVNTVALKVGLFYWIA